MAIVLVILAGPLTSCKAIYTPADINETIGPERPPKYLEGPMEIVILNQRTAIVRQIEDQFRNYGFRIKRFATTQRVAESDSVGRTIGYNESATRYAVELSWQLDRVCSGGGYLFDELSADIIDTQTNEVVASVRHSGRSEGCGPWAGTIFRDLVLSVSQQWPPSKTDSDSTGSARPNP